MESDTRRECPAIIAHDGGSFGFMARQLAVRIRALEPSNMELAADRIGF